MQPQNAQASRPLGLCGVFKRSFLVETQETGAMQQTAFVADIF